jgi:LPS-assembly protein
MDSAVKLREVGGKIYSIILVLIILLIVHHYSFARISKIIKEPVQACVIPRYLEATDAVRYRIAQCLEWVDDARFPICKGAYRYLVIPPVASKDDINLHANRVSLVNEGRSVLSGNVQVQQNERILHAQTAYLYRDSKSNQITRIELLGQVKYLEPGRLIWAREVIVNPNNKAGIAKDVLYRFSFPKKGAVLPAWGRASLIERYANENYFLKKATYTTCAPGDRAWQIEAEEITIDQTRSRGTAKDATLYIGKLPLLRAPYLSFPITKERKSGFLMPAPGYTSVGGFDIAFPYYWNIAPNYDATITPHVYTMRGLMLGGEFRYLTEHSAGFFDGHFLPGDQAYRNFLHNNEDQFPQLEGNSTDRWAVHIQDLSKIYPNLVLRVDFQQVSDDYYLQDFSNNLAILTERQLLRQGELTYTLGNWLFNGKVESYQTLHPINETPISDIYQRLPQLFAYGIYDGFPLNANFSLLAQYDNFYWSNAQSPQVQGPRYYLNPTLSLPQIKPWGFFTPGLELVQNYYTLNNDPSVIENQLSNTIPRASLDTGLYLDRPTSFFGIPLTQTLEPRLYYLYVPFRNQTKVPVYDSAYMIFNASQLFRNNRFSGFDRIGDTNQLSYAITSRWLSFESGLEKASFTIGQIRYFSDRRVPLCQSVTGFCVDDPLFLGFLSPTESFSPIASRAIYRFNSALAIIGDYVWDPALSSTYNADLNLHYQPQENTIIHIGYTYLVNGDITQVADSPLQADPLHQASLAFSLPFSEKWSGLGAFTYNVSKGYSMLTYAGLQYNNCCWATRLLAGRSFQSLHNEDHPRYNNNIYFQVTLKGLGTIGSPSTAGTLYNYIPGFVDPFKR